MFLVLGGVLLGLATQRWNLHRRFALLTVLSVGTKPAQIVFGLMAASWFITMWVSNTATAVIMMPIGGSIILLVKSLGNEDATPKFSAAVLIGIAYAITIGSMATLIGQPPMALMRAYLANSHGLEIGFGHWMLLGVPFALVMLLIAWLVLTKIRRVRHRGPAYPAHDSSWYLDERHRVASDHRRALYNRTAGL